MKGFLKLKYLLILTLVMVILTPIKAPILKLFNHAYAQDSSNITEYQITTSGSVPSSITNGPDGNLWFTEPNTSKIGRITSNGTIVEFSAPGIYTNFPYGGSGIYSFPNRISTGSDGNLWFTEGDSIGQINPITGEITDYPIPTNSGYTSSITKGPDGNLWFTEWYGNKIGKMTSNGVTTEYPISSGGFGLESITAGPDGNIWFMQYYGNNIGRITPTGTITEFPLPTFPIPTNSNGRYNSITAGPDGNLWFTIPGANVVGQITPSGTITEYPVPTSESEPYGITAGSDGNLWFTELAGNNIGRITTSGTITEFPVPSSMSGPESITTGPDGNLWFIEQNGNQIGRVNLPPTNTQAGSNVSVSLSNNITAAFNSVTTTGNTSVTTSDTPPISPASGFTLNGTYYDISTTASFTGPVTITIPYDPSTVDDPSTLHLYHFDSTLNAWVDVTTSIDSVNNTVSGNVNSFSWFAVGTTPLKPAMIWVGLKNSDDVGLKFDLKAEVYNNSTLVSTGETDGVSGGSSGFNNAKLDKIPFNKVTPLEFPSGTPFTIKLFVRNTCTGHTHNSGTARLWLNDNTANSQFGAIIGSSTNNYFLRDNFVLGTTAGTGPKKTIDVAVGSPCSPFKPFGTWTITP